MRRRLWVATLVMMAIIPAGGAVAHAQAGAEYGGASSGSSIPALNPLPQVSRITGTLSQPPAAPAPAPTPTPAPSPPSAPLAPAPVAPSPTASAPAPADTTMADDTTSVAAPDEAAPDASDADAAPPVPDDGAPPDGGGE